MSPALHSLLAEVSRPQCSNGRLAALCAAAAAMAGILLLGLSGWFITGAAMAGAAGIAAVQTFNYLLPSAAIRLLAIIRTVSRYGERLLSHKSALFALATLRVRLFERLLRRPFPADGTSSGEMTALLMQDVQALEDRFVRTPAHAGAFSGGAVALVLALLAGWAAFFALLAVIAVTLVGARLFARHTLPAAARDIQQLMAALKRNLTDYAAAAPEIAAYRFAAPLETQIARQAAALDRAKAAFARKEAALAAMTTVMGSLAIALVLAFSRASPPVTMLAALAAAGALEALGSVIRATGREAVIAAGLSRLSRLASEAAPAPHDAPIFTGDSITLTAPSATIRLSRGDRLAITGRSGAGKTSLLEILAGWRDGRMPGMTMDGQVLDRHNASARRPIFALSPQDAQMIAGTVADNLRLARPGLDDDALWLALEAACLAADVRAMPQGLATWVGDGGAHLSGGQRKRLSLARALLAGRPWLLLDEPSEGLDAETEAALCHTLDRWLRNKGTGLILVTHRPAMLVLAEQRLGLQN
ncbi:ATP-binding cassette domain-containing protein [Sphingobium aquiterrae]|uniref:ATP-binding cassette domain-containing protein n=1 Tax=Sphingobium aquiterrae TaxID=2038656 RepID=UPI003016FB5E